jgi:hypothetical protein
MPQAAPEYNSEELWFRVVAPHRARLLSSSSAERLSLLRQHWPALAAIAFEELCRATVTDFDARSTIGRLGPWQKASRWWQGNLPEWDLVSRGVSNQKLLVGEVKWSPRPFAHSELARIARATATKPLPAWHASDAKREVIRAVFVPAARKGHAKSIGGVRVVTASELIG